MSSIQARTLNGTSCGYMAARVAMMVVWNAADVVQDDKDYLVLVPDCGHFRTI